MGKKKKEEIIFTSWERAEGESFRRKLRFFPGKFAEKMDTVAIHLGYTGYESGSKPLPKRVRSYISMVGNMTRKDDNHCMRPPQKKEHVQMPLWPEPTPPVTIHVIKRNS